MLLQKQYGWSALPCSAALLLVSSMVPTASGTLICTPVNGWKDEESLAGIINKYNMDDTIDMIT